MSNAAQNSNALPVDPLVLSVLTWYANALENAALSAYWKHRGNADDIKKVLDDCLKDLKTLQTRNGGTHDCPWPLCADHVCAPSC